ncbi:MAG: hypothetical protein GXP62_03280 [Oligoflexia bacterium]|nr:hypothetical protein [Oligoflexia bacterium]
METGLLHLHRTLGYAVFFVALIDLVLVLTRARADPRAASALDRVHKFGFMMPGRLNLLLGVVLLVLIPTSDLTSWWAWAGLALWVPIEIINKRLMGPEIALAKDGGTASNRLTLGATLELLIIVTIFGLMTARP